MDSIKSARLGMSDVALLSGNIEAEGRKTTRDVVPHVSLLRQLNVALDDPLVVHHQTAWGVSRFLRLVASEEEIQIKVDPQTAMVGGHVFVKRVVTGGQDGYIGSREDAVDRIPTPIPLVGGLVGPRVF